jgi:hypothetical protein
MQEPDLEEEALHAEVAPGSLGLTVVRRTMAASAGPVTLTGPDGAEVVLQPVATSPGRFEAEWQAPEPGLYRLRDGDLERVVALGPASPREYEAAVASPEPLAAAIEASGGAVTALHEGLPDLRQIRAGRASAGRGWIGITPRGASATIDIRLRPLLPAWAWLLLAAALSLAAWLLEGRRRRPSGVIAPG